MAGIAVGLTAGWAHGRPGWAMDEAAALHTPISVRVVLPTDLDGREQP